MDQENTQEAAAALLGLIESINKSTVAFDEHGNELDTSQKRERARQAAIDQAVKKREAERDAAIEKYKASVKKQTEVVASSINAFTNFGKSIASSPGSFGALNSVVGLATKAFSALASKIPFVGGAIAGMGEAAGEVAKMMIENFEKAYTNFEQLTDVGVVNKFEDLKVSADFLGLTFADTQKVLSKNSKELAIFGGSAILGRQELQRVAEASANARRNFQKLGISAEEFSDFQISYISQQQRYNRGQTKTTQELAEGSQRYIKELDTLSKLTGVSRKQLQAEQEARLRDVRYRAGIANLPKETREGIDTFLAQLKQVAPAVEEGMKDLIASGGIPVTEAGKATMLALEQGGLNVRELVAKLRQGGVEGNKAFAIVAEAAGKAGDKFKGLASIVGDNTIITKNYVELEELRSKRANMTEEEYERQRLQIEANIAAQTGQNAELAKTKTAMYNASRNVEQLATNSQFLTKVMGYMAEGIEWLTEKMYEMSGKPLPEYIKARREEREAIEKETKAKQALIEAEQKYQTLKDPQLARETYAKAEAQILETTKKIDDLTLEQKKANTEVEKKELQQKIEELQKQRAIAQQIATEARNAAQNKKIKENLERQKNEAEQKSLQATREKEATAKKRIEAEAAAGLAKKPTTAVPTLPKEAEKTQLEKNVQERDADLQSWAAQSTLLKNKIKQLKEEKKDVTHLEKELDNVNKQIIAARQKYNKAVEEQKTSELTALAKRTQTTAPSAPKEDPRIIKLKQQEEGWAAAAKNYAEDLDKLKQQLAKAEQDKDKKEIEKLTAEKNEKLKQLANANKQKEAATKELANIEAAKARKEREAKAAAVTGGAATPAAPGATPAAAPGGAGSAIKQLKDAGLILKEGDVQTSEGGVDPRVIEIAKQVQAQIPGFKMFTGFNDRFHQEKAPNSQHTKGLAFDFTTVVPPSKEEGQKIVEMLKGLGLDYVVDEYNNPSRQATSGHFHGQLKAYDGGVFKGPKSGYEVQLHGSEAVVPLPDGKSIPVQNVTSPTFSDTTSKIFEDMNDKFDTIIDLLTRGNSIQDNIARNMA